MNHLSCSRSAKLSSEECQIGADAFAKALHHNPDSPQSGARRTSGKNDGKQSRIIQSRFGKIEISWVILKKSLFLISLLVQYIILIRNNKLQVPNYLRTKPDPEVEARHSGYAQRGGIPSPDEINKRISVLEKITRDTLKIITREREELEHR